MIFRVDVAEAPSGYKPKTIPITWTLTGNYSDIQVTSGDAVSQHPMEDTSIWSACCQLLWHTI